MLTDIQLEELCQKMNIPLEGVYFKDELPRKLAYNRSYIINIQNSVDEEGKPNEGTHYTALQVNKYPNGRIEPIYFDPFGASPSESIKKFVLDNCGKKLPYTRADVQSLMNGACGWFVTAFLHYINAWEHRTRDLYDDVSCFMSYFDDLDTSIDWKKNEYILKQFFQSKDPNFRRSIDVISDTNNIMGEDEKGGPDMMKVPVDLHMK